MATVCQGIAGPEIVDVTEDIRADTEWSAEKIYVLRGPIYVHPQ